MSNPSDDLLRLPKGLDSPDPVDGNPFPESDVRYGFWKRATKEAEKEHSDLVLEALKRGRPTDLDGIVAWDIWFQTGRYDIWAKRGVHVILSEELLEGWYQWLANYANEILKGYASLLTPPDEVLQRLRDQLIRRREFWKAEARRYVALQAAHRAKLNAASGASTSPTGLPVLPDRVQRILEIYWQGLLDTYRFGGDAVCRYADAGKKARAIALSKPPDSAGRHFKGWLTGYMRAKHECGITSSAEVATRWLGAIAEEYLKLWEPISGWELFADWLRGIRARVLSDIETLWKRNDATARWYQDVCAAAVTAATSAKIQEFERRARLQESVFLLRAQSPEIRATDNAGILAAKTDREKGPSSDELKQPVSQSNPVVSANPPSLTWDDIAICFLDSESVEVKVGDHVRHLHYAEMGFADRRGKVVGHRGPVEAWRWLKHLAKNRRIIDVPNRREPRVPKGPPDIERQPASQLKALEEQRGSTVKGRTKLQSSVKDLRRRLRLHFPSIPGEPIIFEETQYRALFQVGTAEYFRD